jgi:apolipoprotein N-acyltransferase
MTRFAGLKPYCWPDVWVLVAALLGAVSVLGFAPFHFSPLVLLALAGLFWLWARAPSVSVAFAYGLWFGLGLFGVGVSWIFSAMYFYSGVPMAAAIVLVAGFVVLMALFVALAGALARSVYRDEAPGRALLWLFPAAWVLLEVLRYYLFGGLPFLLTGTSHIGSWLDGYAPVLGVLGVSFVVAITAGVLVWFVRHQQALPAALLIAFLWPIGGVLQKTTWVTPVDEPIEVALIQTNAAQDEKWQRDRFWTMMREFIAMTRDNLDADVIIWPETAIPGFFDQVAQGPLQRFLADAQLQSSDILVGVIARDSEKQAYFNAMVNLRDPQQVYHKRRLVLFGEYYPFGALSTTLADWFGFPLSQFSAGANTQPLLSLGGQPAGVSICFEMLFAGELARDLPAARYFITTSNDAWFAHTLEPAQMRQEAQMRARELGRELVRVNNTGYSSVIGVDGQVKAELAPNQSGVLRAHVQPYEGMTPYARWGNSLILLLVIGLFAGVWAKRYAFTGRFRLPTQKKAK